MAKFEMDDLDKMMNFCAYDFFGDGRHKVQISEAGADVLLNAIETVAGRGSQFAKYAVKKLAKRTRDIFNVFYDGDTETSARRGKPYRTMGAAIVYSTGRKATESGRTFGKRKTHTRGRVKSSQEARPFFQAICRYAADDIIEAMQLKFDAIMQEVENETKTK